MRKFHNVLLVFSMLTMAACAKQVPHSIEIEGFSFDGAVFHREVASNVTSLTLLISLYPSDEYTLYSDQSKGEEVTHVVSLTKGRNTFYLEVNHSSAQTYMIVVDVLPQLFAVTFHTAGGSLVRSETVSDGVPLTQPNTPTRTGYHFKMWSIHPVNEVPFNFSTPINQNLTLYAIWGPNLYTITFDTLGGNALSPVIRAYLSSINPLPTPVKAGYSFMGWSHDVAGLEPFLMTSMPFNHFTLYAKWSK